MAAKKDESVQSLVNIGKVTAQKLAVIGIETKEQFLARDPYDIFDQLLEQVDSSLCRCALAQLVGAKQGKPWHEVTKQSAREYEKRNPAHEWGPC